MLVRFDPFRDFDRLTQHVFGELSRASVVAADAFRQSDRFVVRFDLPGVSPDSVEVTVEKNVLSVSGTRSWEPEEGTEVLFSERPQGTFTRQLYLGRSLDTDHVEANCDNGVLTVTIPIADEAKPRRVEITTGSAHTEAVESGRAA
jgi:HSP20 family protein